MAVSWQVLQIEAVHTWHCEVPASMIAVVADRQSSG